MEVGGSPVMSTDIDNWISGETDVFFNPGKAQKRNPFWKRTHYVIAIVVSTGCVLTVIGFVSSSLFSAQAPISARSAPIPALPVPSRLPAPPTIAADNHSTFKPVIRLPIAPQSDLTEQSVEESGDRVLSYLNSIYSPMVTYYGKQLPKEAVLRDKYYFLKRWPIRQTWETESPTISCNEAAAECEITGVRKYKAMNVDQGSHASGVVRYAYAIRFSEGSPQIVVENSKTVR
jgi:hypothetical protein